MPIEFILGISVGVAVLVGVAFLYLIVRIAERTKP
jgi:hypothetical protein